MAELGFGIMRFRGNECHNISEIKEIIDEYMMGDFCYFDLHPSYCAGKSQQIFKTCIADVYSREKYLVANKMPFYGVSDYSDYNRIFTEELSACGVDYFDYYMLHCINLINYDYHKQNGGFRFLKDIKGKGAAKKIGLSFHGTPELLEDILNKYEYIDFVQLQINFVDWENNTVQSKRCYDIVRKYGKEILVMEPIKGGTISKNIGVGGKTYSAEEMADLSLRFVSGLEGISVILSGMIERNHVINNRISLKRKPLPYDYFYEIIQQLSNENIISCTKCGYCKQECVKNIDIPNILEIANESLKSAGEGLSRLWIAKIYYNGITNEEFRASNCIGCGKCEVRCPQGIKIRDHLKCAALFLDEKDNEKVRYFHRIYKTYIKELMLGKKVKECHIKYKQNDGVYLYGAGKMFEKYHSQIQKQFDVVAVIDMDKNKQGKEIFGIRCIDIKDVPKEALIIIMIENEKAVEEIAVMLKENGYFSYDYYWNWIDGAEQFWNVIT